MSDTLQERESARRQHEQIGGEYRCSKCRAEFKTIPDFDKHKCESTYCNECKGPPHAPWCSEYKEPDERCPFTRTWVPDPCVLPKGHTGKHLNAIEQEIAISEHQPATRGGGEGGRIHCGRSMRYDAIADGDVSTMQPTYETVAPERWRQTLEVLRSTVKGLQSHPYRYTQIVVDRYLYFIETEIDKALHEQRSTSE